MNLIQLGLTDAEKFAINSKLNNNIAPKLERLQELAEKGSTEMSDEEAQAITSEMEQLQSEISDETFEAQKELSQRRDINSISDSDKEHLFAIINSLGLPSTELDYGIIQSAFDAYNQSKDGRVSQIMGEKETISQSADLTPEDVMTQHQVKDNEINTIRNIGSIHVNGYEKKAVNKDLVKSKLLKEANKVLDELSSVADEEGIIKFSDADQILAD